MKDQKALISILFWVTDLAGLALAWHIARWSGLLLYCVAHAFGYCERGIKHPRYEQRAERS